MIVKRSLVFAILLCARMGQAVDLFLDDPTSLAQLEKQGFDFARLALNEKDGVSNNEALTRNRVYATIVKSLGQDLQDLKKKDPRLFISMKGVHRLFDSQWLAANYAFYELVGIINRMDRLSFNPSSCGEMRFIYRLAYQTHAPSPVYSRLPMTINSVFWIPRGAENCQGAARLWTAFRAQVEKGSLSKISRRSLPLGDLKSIEINMQSVRWPSTIRPDMAGYAEYILRVFSVHNGKAAPATLENTPDVGKLERNPKLKNDLLMWLSKKENLSSIDQGVVLMPEAFLTTQVTSVALHGVHRLKNAPFSRLFTKTDFSKLDLKSYESFQTSAGLLRRLNDLSCVGCHQGRTVAGFHFLGRDKEKTDAVNSIFISASPHFLLDQKRRGHFIERLKQNENPEHRRPLSVRADSNEGKNGSHCGLGDASFGPWTCQTGFHCRAFTEDSEVSPTGICVPVNPISGSPCTTGKMTHNPDSKKDHLKLQSESSCGDASVCESSSVGFPNGMCAGRCQHLKPGETCGSIAELFAFNSCLAAGKDHFAKCLGENVRPASMQECDPQSFCRDDYICARTLSGKGACIPPYFLFQLRVDGHPSPGLGDEKFTVLDRLRKLLPQDF